MKTKKSIVKVITSLLLAILILFNLNINYQVINAKDNTNSELTTNDGTNDEKKVSKVKVPTDNNISEVNGKKYVNNDILIFFKDGVKINEINNIINSIDGSIVGQVSELNEYQVKVKKSSLDELNNIISNLMNKYSNSIDFASVDYISKNTSIIPDDPWGNDNKWDEENASGNNWGLEAIQAQSAWQYNNIFDESVNKINMGVVDGGFDTTAEDFPDSYEKFSNTNYDLPHDHGTFVTSIMAAKANNNKGITGIVWNPGKIYLASASSSKNSFSKE